MDHATADARPVVTDMSKYAQSKHSDVRKPRSSPNLFELEQTLQLALTRIEYLTQQVKGLPKLDELDISHGTLVQIGNLLYKMRDQQEEFAQEMAKKWEVQGVIQQKLNTTVANLCDHVNAVLLGQNSLQGSMDARWNTVDRTLSKLDATLRDNTAALQEATGAKMECLVCMDKERNTVILPCSHFAVCGECLARCRNCPVCRGPVGGSIKVYSA